MLEENKRLELFLKEKSLFLAEKISKGYSSEIFLVKNKKGKKFALKIEKEKSPRKEMAEREAGNLRLANSAGIGPKLFGFDLEKRIILMEYIEGLTFSKWLFSNPPKKDLKKILESLLSQAKKLDEIGLDHGQLAGKGKNILIESKTLKPIIVDFEKASQNRKCGNYNQLFSLFYKNPYSELTKKIKEILEVLD